MASDLTDHEISKWYYISEDSGRIRNSPKCVECDQKLDRDVDRIDHLKRHFKVGAAFANETETDHCPFQPTGKIAFFCDQGLYCKLRETPKHQDSDWSAVDLSRWLNAAKALRNSYEPRPADLEIDLEKAWLERGIFLDRWQSEAQPLQPLWARNISVIATHAPNIDISLLNAWSCWSSPGKFKTERDGLWKIRYSMKPLLVLLPIYPFFMVAPICQFAF